MLWVGMCGGCACGMGERGDEGQTPRGRGRRRRSDDIVGRLSGRTTRCAAPGKSRGQRHRRTVFKGKDESPEGLGAAGGPWGDFASAQAPENATNGLITWDKGARSNGCESDICWKRAVIASQRIASYYSSRSHGPPRPRPKCPSFENLASRCSESAILCIKATTLCSRSSMS